MGTTTPEYQTVRIWVRTVRALRLVAALTSERMVQVLDRLVQAELERVQKHLEQERADEGNAQESEKSRGVDLNGNPVV